MALTAFTRFRFLWGAVDWQGGSGNPYATAQTGTLGTSAVASGGVGVRRVVCTLDRTALEVGLDPCVVHFDFLNITGGSPDETWTTADYTTLEGLLDTFWSSVSVNFHAGMKMTTYTWYRIGVGVTKPNPAVRQLVKTTPIAGTGTGAVVMPPQVASSITFRTAVRTSWGRTYIPVTASSNFSTPGRWASSAVDALCGAANTLLTGAAGADFYQVVYSKHLSAALNVERLEVDNVTDIIRRRRFPSSTYKKLLP